MAKKIVTNTDVGPRGFYSEGALVMLEAGESTPEAVEVDDGAGDYFEFGAKAAKEAEEKADDKKC